MTGELWTPAFTTLISGFLGGTIVALTVGFILEVRRTNTWWTEDWCAPRALTRQLVRNAAATLGFTALVGAVVLIVTVNR